MLSKPLLHWVQSIQLGISPTPIYKQMEKLEEKKREAQNKLAEMQSTGFVKDEPCELQDFQRFLKVMSEILRSMRADPQWNIHKWTTD